MAKSIKKIEESPPSLPVTTQEARENQMISLAIDLAEQQLRDGTATSQVITHYLKLGSTNYQLEKEKLKTEIALANSKIEQIEQGARIEESYRAAMEAMSIYKGEQVDD